MIYRRLDENGDYIFGSNMSQFLKDAEAIVQVIYTKIKLLRGEWWEDIYEGTPLFENMLGKPMTPQMKDALDLIVRDRIMGIDGVETIFNLVSEFDTVKRTYIIKSCDIQTIYGNIEGLSFEI